MKWKFLNKTAAAVMSLLGINKIPMNGDASATEFTADQRKELEAKLGTEKTQKIIDAFDNELKAMNDANADLTAIDAELEAFLAENPTVNAELNGADTSDDDEDENEDEDQDEDDDQANASTAQPRIIASLQKRVSALTKGFSAQKKTIEALMDAEETEIKPQNTIAVRTNTLKHSATHLFAIGKPMFSYENRPWNERLRDSSAKVTDFNNDSYIPTLVDDAKHFVLEYPEALESLMNDNRMLPAEWDRISGVLDRVASGNIITGEIVQGRAKGWSPKNKFKISAEEGRVFAKKIDITFSGYELQQIENTWIRSYNREGSHPWKMTFVYFLLGEIMKRQALDDRNAMINGIFVQTPENREGAAVNSQDGLLYLFYQFRDVLKKYRPTHLGNITPENVVDKVKQLIEGIPEIDRRSPGLELGITETVLGWYRERAGLIYQLQHATDEGKQVYSKDHPIDYPNIKFQPIVDMTKTTFMYITQSKNIQQMDYRREEKNAFTFTMDKRDINIFTDYKEGIRLKQVGVKLAEGETPDFERQMIWSNEAPIFDASVSVPAFDDETGILKVVYPVIRIDQDFKTNITAIEGVQPGQVVKVYGTSKLSAARQITKNAKIDITSNYALNTNGYILMYVNADGTLKELKRTTTAETPQAQKIEFDGDVLDVANGTEFHFNGAEAETLADIINGVDGKSIKIFGKSVDEKLTISATDTISVAASVELTATTHYIELVNVNGVWFEVNKVTA